MKASNYSFFTCRLDNIHSSNIIYNLMIRGGLLRKISSGIYVWLPYGLKIINNIIKVIKCEMSKIYALELILPIIQPKKLWEKSNRLFNYGDELFKFYDRNSKLLILSPTHEEIITSLICNESNILNDLPKIFYQIQTKFRDEIRPRLGIIRSKEFIMKDAYSFHNSIKCLNKTYNLILNIYKNIFLKLGLNVYFKQADCGSIGGYLSHEFHVLSDIGEDKLNVSFDKISYLYSDIYRTKNIYNYKKKKLVFIKKMKGMKKQIILNKFVKTIIIKIYEKNIFFFILVLIPFKKKIDLKKIIYIYPLSLKVKVLNNSEVYNIFNFNKLFLGPLGLNYPIIVDYSIFFISNFTIGANKNHSFYLNINLGRDIKVENFYDVCKNKILNLYLNFNKKKSVSFRSIEIAHIFKLRDKYSKVFNINYKNQKKKVLMGCYGIGINRIVSALVNNYNNNTSIIWPISITYFKLGIIPINMYNNKYVYKLIYEISFFLKKNNIKFLLDDRKLHLGKMLTDFELLGIPILVIISEKSISTDLIELRDRINNSIVYISKNRILNYLFFKCKF